MNPIRAVMLVALVSIPGVLTTSTTLASEMPSPTLVDAERAELVAAKVEASKRMREPEVVPQAPTPPPAPQPKPKPAPQPVVAESSTPPVVDHAGPCGGWESLIASYFPGEVGTACRVMMCESGGSTTVHNHGGSGASGLWQFMPGTWETTTGTPAPASNYSAEAQTAAAAKLRRSSGWGQWSCY